MIRNLLFWRVLAVSLAVLYAHAAFERNKSHIAIDALLDNIEIHNQQIDAHNKRYHSNQPLSEEELKNLLKAIEELHKKPTT